MEVSTRDILLDDATVRTYTFGHGRPVFLIPPWPLSGRVYLFLAPYLNDAFKVTTLDLPEWAGSSRFTKPSDYSVLHYRQVVNTVFERWHIHGEPVDVGGVSMGGLLGLFLASDFGPSVRRLTMLGSPLQGTYIPKLQNSESFMASTLTWPERLPLLYPFFKSVTFLLFLRWRMLKQLNPLLAKTLFYDYRQLNFKAACLFARDFLRSDFHGLASQLDKPVLLISASGDKIVPSEYLDFLAQKVLKQATHITISGEDHHVLGDNPKVVAELFREGFS